MTAASTALHVLPCLDSDEMAARCRRQLAIPRDTAAALGKSAVEACRLGYYMNSSGEKVDWNPQVLSAYSAKKSISPNVPLPTPARMPFHETRVQVANETALEASRRMVERGLRPLALNFANGIHPGGGFLNGARAQEEALCRSSALYWTLNGDPMYTHHRSRARPDSTDWAIYSPDVPVFRTDDGIAVDRPWLLSFLTAAAPYAPDIGEPESADLLERRILRVLAVARAYGHVALVLGAWGCGAFGNNPRRTAVDFRRALESNCSGVFSEVVFAIADWSPERTFLSPFRDVFS